jgi:hypothetical protein
VRVSQAVQNFESHQDLAEHVPNEVAPRLQIVIDDGHPLLKALTTMRHTNFRTLFVDFVAEQLGQANQGLVLVNNVGQHAALLLLPVGVNQREDLHLDHDRLQHTATILFDNHSDS